VPFDVIGRIAWTRIAAGKPRDLCAWLSVFKKLLCGEACRFYDISLGRSLERLGVHRDDDLSSSVYVDPVAAFLADQRIAEVLEDSGNLFR